MARSTGITAACAALSIQASLDMADPAASPRRPAPAGPAEVCGLRGGLDLPDTRSCPRIGGSVMAEAAGTAGRAPSIVPAVPGRSDRGATAFRPRGRVDVDVRTDTPFGPARAFVSVETR